MEASLHLLLVVVVVGLLPIAASLNADGLSLLALKSAISGDPGGALSSWSHSSATPCNWTGVSCDAAARVSSLSLPSLHLSGYIPSELALLRHLHRLDLSSNLLTGPLPASLASLRHLSATLNLSHNLLSGPIPTSFALFPPTLSLDLSHNNLSGPIPQLSPLLNQGPTAFTANPSLCGLPLHTPCSAAGDDTKPSEIPRSDLLSVYPAPEEKEEAPARGLSLPILSITGAFAVVGAVTVAVWLARRQWEGKREMAKAEERAERVAEGELRVFEGEGFGVELEELLRAAAYVVGKGRSGIVYKVVAAGGVTVTVRRLSEGGWCWHRREFQAEVEAIASVRHPNVVCLRAFYFAADEKLLISDFIDNGNLHVALHGGPLSPCPPLSWVARLKIAQGTARGLAYIHNCSPRKYVHGNIKSSKILLDQKFNAYISGFGLNRLVISAHNKPSPTLTPPKVATNPFASYLAPEAQASPGSKLTQKCDIYAFGMVMMELLTGRAAEAGLEGLVRRAFREERPLAEIVDPRLLQEVHAKKQVVAAFHLALGCTELDPDLRPKMRAVCEILDRIG